MYNSVAAGAVKMQPDRLISLACYKNDTFLWFILGQQRQGFYQSLYRAQGAMDQNDEQQVSQYYY